MKETILSQKDYHEIPIVKTALEELRKFDEWNGRIATIGSSHPVNLVQMKDRILKAQEELKENLHEPFLIILEQVEECLEWTIDAEAILLDEDPCTNCIGLDHIKKVTDDTCRSLALIDQNLLIRLEAHCFKKIFIVNPSEIKKTAVEFMNYIRKHIPEHLFKHKELIEKENEIMKLCRKIEVREMRKQTLDVSIDEANALIGAENYEALPFFVSTEIKHMVQC